MSRILLTGMAARGVGSTKVKHHIVSLPDVLGRALRELGHEVDGPRRVRLDEPLSGYDAVWVQLGWVSSLSSTYAHEAARVMADFDGPAVRYVDDWRSQWLADDIAGHVQSEKGWAKHWQRFRAEAWSTIEAGDRERYRDALLAPIQGAPLLVPIMGWGDASKFDVSTKARLSKVVPFDPQRLVDYHTTKWAPDAKRQKRWVVASLQEHDKWVASLGLEWDVLKLGANPKLPGGVPIKGHQNQVIPESEVCQIYAESWGVLSPEYDSAGSGYWRTRWFQAMEAGAILWPGPRDAEAFGWPLSQVEDPRHIEQLGAWELKEFAAQIGQQIWDSSWPEERAYAALQGAAEGGI